jgi:hypothetical protein
MSRIVTPLVALVAVVAGCGSPRGLEVSKDGTYQYESTLQCLRAEPTLKTYAHPRSGTPIRSLSVYDGEQESATVYVASSDEAARQVADVMLSDEPMVYGNVVLVWTDAMDDVADALNRCLDS